MTDLIGLLPHRPPFLFVSRVSGSNQPSSGESNAPTSDPNSFTAEWKITGEEWFFAGHFPGDPIVPGVLLTEALAQTAGILLASWDQSAQHAGALVHCDIRFRAPVRPPAVVFLRVTLDGDSGKLFRFVVSASVANQVVADGSLVLAVKSPPAHRPDSQRVDS